MEGILTTVDFHIWSKLNGFASRESSIYFPSYFFFNLSFSLLLISPNVRSILVSSNSIAIKTYFSCFFWVADNLNFSRQPYFCCPWQIPGNTGCIARTCAATSVGLHLVGVLIHNWSFTLWLSPIAHLTCLFLSQPLGFQVDDAKLKRAGLDYWPYPCTSSVKGSFS